MCTRGARLYGRLAADKWRCGVDGWLAGGRSDAAELRRNACVLIKRSHCTCQQRTTLCLRAAPHECTFLHEHQINKQKPHASRRRRRRNNDERGWKNKTVTCQYKMCKTTRTNERTNGASDATRASFNWPLRTAMTTATTQNAQAAKKYKNRKTCVRTHSAAAACITYARSSHRVSLHVAQ